MPPSVLKKRREEVSLPFLLWRTFFFSFQKWRILGGQAGSLRVQVSPPFPAYFTVAMVFFSPLSMLRRFLQRYLVQNPLPLRFGSPLFEATRLPFPLLDSARRFSFPHSECEISALPSPLCHLKLTRYVAAAIPSPRLLAPLPHCGPSQLAICELGFFPSAEVKRTGSRH